MSKTIAIKLWKDVTFFNKAEGKDLRWQHKGKFTMLGIDFDLGKVDITSSNYPKKVASFKKALNAWTARNLTIYGRITIIKSIALPKLVHLFNTKPHPPTNVLQEIQNTCFSFIWGTVDKIKRTTMYSDYENGGLKLLHIESFCHSQNLTWLKRLLDDLNFDDWKLLFNTCNEKHGGNVIWLAKEKNTTFFKHLNSFAPTGF
jgi:hypothetical protein